ncbi:glycerate kinase [Nocardia asteroides]|uniref:Glycerate kinase n=1 Tax=Nocardia asteroides NBRC 15531 TaxID=1110697 RepID=U5E6E5_NOCAS|nr:glycerate kinase [Nocardia asteroides]TLF69232.1 glycerate kinase [Nocardia asteroides NBRC 15531]UGT48721.1 glycerate kinase [Nocardia asteroides]SFL68969.1 glycerate kinase [Nocardia asteroides]VEG31627.1 Glycerate kinase [Nocardia asteroides]GAD85457.1 putative glycerate kinase [Nocardia asteroides NBRC 15531]
MTDGPRVVLAPDKFKGSLTAPEVAAALAAGIHRGDPAADVRCVPVADGGDGMVDAFVAAGWDRVEIAAPGPTGEPSRAVYALHGDTAVVELAAAVGVAKLPAGRLDPLGANTVGLGRAVVHALDNGAREIVLGLGGSASSDGGVGLLSALGLRLLDQDGRELPVDAAGFDTVALLSRVVAVDRAGLHPAIAQARFTLACDVDNPLLGPAGAVAVYAPQKGADPRQMANLEAALTNWAAVLGTGYAEIGGAGAAGGTGFGALAVLGAQVRSGIDVLLELLEFRALLAGAQLVVTGEGSLDHQSMRGKAPVGVAAAAKAAGVPVVAAVGRTMLSPGEIRAAGFTECYTLADLEPDPARSIANAAALLERVGERIAGKRW